MTLPLPDSCLYEAVEFEIATGFLGEQEGGAQGVTFLLSGGPLGHRLALAYGDYDGS